MAGIVAYVEWEVVHDPSIHGFIFLARAMIYVLVMQKSIAVVLVPATSLFRNLGVLTNPKTPK